MKPSFWLLVFCVFGVLAPLWGQEITISIRVLDESDDHPMSQAFVSVNRTSPKQTGPDGLASFTVRDASIRLDIQASGYEPFSSVLLDSAAYRVVRMRRRVATLDEVVVTGLPEPSRLQDATHTYQIITAATMRAQGAVSVADALRTTLNVNVGADNVLGSTTSLQGMKGDKVKILIDGLPVNGRENGQVDLGQIMTQNVQRIEIIQGPLSVVYGTDALGGVINIITGNKKRKRNLTAETYYETLGKYNANVSLSHPIGQKQQVTIGGGRNYFEGWKPLDPLNRSFLWLPKEQYFGNIDYNYKTTSGVALRFASDYTWEKLTNKAHDYTVTPFKAYALDNYYRTTRWNNRLTLSGKTRQGATWQSQNSYALYYRLRNLYYKDLVTLDQQLVTGAGNNDTTQFDNFSFRGLYAHKIRRIGYSIGYDINLEKGRSGKLDTAAGKDIQDYALFATCSLPLWRDKLVLEPAIRWTHNTAYQAPLIPSFNALFKANDALQIRFSYAAGFRAPSLKERYLHFYDSNHEVEGNPNLQAEHGDHLQASLSWTAYRQESNYIRLLTTAFYNDLRNQIGLLMPDSLRPSFAVYTNVARLQNLIGSLQGEAQWKRWFVQTGFSYMRLLSAASGGKNSYQATAAVQWALPQAGFTLSTFYKYFGRQPRLVNDASGSSSYNGTLAPYSTWDFSAERAFWKKRVSVVVGVRNILDVQTVGVAGATATGAHTGSVSGNNISPGRSVFSSLRLSL